MKCRSDVIFLFSFLFVGICSSSLQASEPTRGKRYLHHGLTVTLSPQEHRISVVDSVTLPRGAPAEPSFTLHSGLIPSSPSPRVRIVKLEDKWGAVPLETYKVILPAGIHAFVVTYEGTLYHPLEQEDTAQARGFQDTPGIISEEGVVLSAAASWYPDFGAGLVTFNMKVKLPPRWDAVSQGTRVRHNQGSSATLVRWKSPEPQESIYLIAARFTQYTLKAGPLTAMVFLRTPDEAMANAYLDATVDYVKMYSALIGPYPYKKFALVENFWETGFGMPSFTLLGPTVIRLPFIINSSYPHEILHSWWGNSVFPDYEQGNWSEGLTAYLADHLLKEQQGEGAEFRVDTLQKYADYVIDNRDFPLTQFRSRHSSSSEAVGYGKSLMFFHMLRLSLGDDAFKQGIREFYKQYRFRSATFTSIRTSFERVSGRDLKPEFEQWTDRAGAPELKIADPKTILEGERFLLTATLEQAQSGEAYHLRVPVAVTLEGRVQAFQTVIEMKEKKQDMKISLPARPLRLDIDPEFDLFRRLDHEEVPAAVSQALGAQQMLIVLPAGADEKMLEAYRAFAETLGRSGPDEIEVNLDSEITQLPLDRAITVIGWENHFVNEVVSTLFGYGVDVSNQSVHINQTDIPRQHHSFILTTRVSGNDEAALMFVAADSAEALPGLGRKLPHYHKYSYLAFEGQEPAIVTKGRWPVLNSPLTVFFPNKEGNMVASDMGKLAPREPLVRLAPVLSKVKER